MEKVSVVMITFNNSRTVENALLSVASWASEIIVVDSFSTDNTYQIVEKYATYCEQRKWPGFRDQYNYCISKAANDWVMFIDADEVISPELAKEVSQRIASDGGTYDGYIAHRRNFYLGRWIMHGGWVPDYEIRLFRKSRGGFEGALHANVKVRGKVGELRHFYYHYNYKDIADQIDTINRYSETAARDMREQGKTFSYLDLLFRPPWRFVKEYLLKRGFLDGFPGFVIAVSTMYYVFIKYAKLREMERDMNRGEKRES
ncbi:MAG TPA: glycosyltransferase family 2 protein [Deltaproteobacteria bacterium]|nr:glycosyltransferase family 2 protein [Deltaproteobacteria bacterium]